MFLKRIRTRNFKSFSGVAEVPLAPGFTGIAGPNGMGKSNIADAILFVLGPTSSKVLRADRLPHLFFNGGASKKAASECEVALQFDNRDRLLPVDSDEVELSRYVKLAPSDPDGYYSYFYVNGHRSTQSELDNILAHARLAGDGYNIVQQGDVTKIVSMGSVPRRSLVERVAGISHYDEELDRAAIRRSELEQNLERIKTLLQEIRGHLESLESQRIQAIRYKQFQDEKRRAEARLARAGLLLARQEVETCEAQLRKITDQVARLRTEGARLEGERDKLAGALSAVEAEVARRSGEDAPRFKTELDERRMAFARLEERVQTAREGRAGLEARAAALKQEVQTAEHEVAELGRREKELTESLSAVTLELDRDRKAVDELTGQTENSRGKLVEIRKQSLAHQKKLEAQERAWQEAVRALEATRGSAVQAEQEKARAEDEVEARQLEVKDLELRVKQFKGAGGSAGRTLLDLQGSFLALKSKEKILTDRAETLNQEVQELNRRYLALDARLKARSGNGASSSPQAAVDFILSQRNLGKLSGVRGTVDELAEYDPQYQTALTVAAGSRFHALVVETDQVAEECIKLLRSEKRGRATFLPLNRMLAGRPHGKSLIAARAPGAVGFALDLIRFEETLRPAFWHVFGETVVVDDLTHARDLMGGVRLVTLQGDLVEATGAMTGGFLDLSSRGGADSVAELKRVGQELRAKSEEETATRKELLKVGEQVRAQAEELARRSGQDESQSAARKVIDQELLQARDRLKEAEGRVLDVEAALREARERLEKAETHASAIQAEVAELKTAQQKLQEEYLAHIPGAISDKIRSLQETIQKAGEERVRLEREVAGTQASAKAAAEQLAARRAELVGLQKSRAAGDRQIKLLEKERDESKSALDALRAVETKQLAAVQDLVVQRTGLEGERMKVLEALTKTNGQVETQLALQQREEVRLAQARQTLTEVEAAITEFPPSPEEEAKPVPVDQLKRKISELNAQIDALGLVNLRALDEYDSEKRRLDEFDQEVQRLTDERAELQKLVDEVERKKRTRLTEVVTAVNEAFRAVYAELSGGGEGEIGLENPDDPLAGGLLIKARPVGKKVQRIEQLSGGEKSLASLAFVFALQRYDPSPLYVFDEVDMSLDAVNAENLGRMLRRNSERAQFMVISLRKVTLKFAHRLFGVTMHGDGCSRVVALKLDEIVDVDERERSGIEVGSEAA